MGRHELCVVYCSLLKWAHTNAWVQLYSPYSGPIRAHRQVAVHLHGGPLRAFSVGSHPAVYESCGPTHQSRVPPSCVIDGPIQAMCFILPFVDMGLYECFGHNYICPALGQFELIGK